MKITEIIKHAGKTAIFPHTNPDSDALGSCLALKKLVEFYGFSCTIFAEEEIPVRLGFLGGDFKIFNGESEKFDTAIAVDCGDEGRIQSRLPLFSSAGMRLNIDHHITNTNYGDINFVVPEAAATAEIVFDLYKECCVPIDKEAANSLYAAISGDTGGFRFQNTTEKTHLIAAELIKSGAETARISTELFERKSMGKIKLESAAINEMRLFHGGRTVICPITATLMEKLGATDEETDSISGILRGIDNVDAAVTLKEKNGVIKASMRTEEAVDAAKICAMLGGGGHARAAGATMEGTMEECINRIVTLIGESYGWNN